MSSGPTKSVSFVIFIFLFRFCFQILKYNLIPFVQKICIDEGKIIDSNTNILDLSTYNFFVFNNVTNSIEVRLDNPD